MTREEVLTILKAHRDDLVRFGVKSLRLPTFAEYMKLRFFLEDLLGTSIDPMTETGLRSRVRPYMEKTPSVPRDLLLLW